MVPFCSYPTINRNVQKNCKKLKNIITASFEAIIGWKRLRKRENRNYRTVTFLTDVLEKIKKKIAKKFKKIKKITTA